MSYQHVISRSVTDALDEVWNAIDAVKVMSSDIPVPCSREVCLRCTLGFFAGRLDCFGEASLKGNFSLEWARGFVSCWRESGDVPGASNPIRHEVSNVPKQCPYLTEHAVCADKKA